MPYITSFERDGIRDGIVQGSLQNARESVIEVLETRFSVVPAVSIARVNEIDDLARLKRLHKQAITIASVEEFEGVLGQGEAES